VRTRETLTYEIVSKGETTAGGWREEEEEEEEEEGEEEEDRESTDDLARLCISSATTRDSSRVSFLGRASFSSPSLPSLIPYIHDRPSSLVLARALRCLPTQGG